MMDDEFLRQFWEPPRPEFVQAIREKLKEAEQPRSKMRWKGRWVAAAVLLIAGGIAACIFTPLKNIPLLSKTEQIIYGKRQVIEGERQVFHLVSLEAVPFAKVQERLPFPISLPNYVPAGFSPSNTAYIFLSDKEGNLMMEWIGNNGKRIRLFAIYPTDKAIRWPGTARSLQVGGRLVILTTEGDTVLSWVEQGDKVAYALVAENNGVPESELIKMVETIPISGGIR